MIITRREYHTVISCFDYDVSEEDIIDAFGSVEEFWTHYEEESDEFNEFMFEQDYDRNDDWVTDRKGGYDVEWEIEE